MRDWKRILLYTGACAFTLIALYVAFYFVFLNFFVDLWWFRSLEFEGYFWLRLLYRFFIGGGITLAFFSIFFFHFWIASSYLGINAGAGLQPGSRSLLQLFQSGSLKVFTPLSLVLAIVVAIPLYQQWESALLFFFGSASGIKDQVFGNDISFYLFDYPVFQLVQRELLTTAFLLFVSITFLYWLEHRLVPANNREYPLGAKIHLAILWGFVVLFVTWGFMLDRFSLLEVDRHEPVFFGPGFVEIRYYLPLIWLSIVAFLSIGISAPVLAFHRSTITKTVLIVSIVSLIGMVGLQNIAFIPAILERFIVKPNPVKAEKHFMEHNIQATLNAYDLNEVETIDFSVTLTPESNLAQWVNEEHVRSIPVWDRELLDDVYQQMQGIRPYYRFDSIDEDRYLINGKKVQVNIAAREVNIENLPKEAQSWENRYLRYIHGYGAVMTPAAQEGGRPMEWYLRDLNHYSDVNLKVANPDIYYGQEALKRAIVPNELSVVGLSGTDSEPMKNYSGDGGVPIPSLFRKMLFWFYFDDEKIFFSTNINTQSKILFRRNIKERIATLAPYLALDSDPYLVLTSKGFFWIQDAYTLSDWYPVSKHTRQEFKNNPWGPGEKRFNYIRNAVKVVVDAYNGTTTFYIADSSDPIIQAYNRAYPGVFLDLDEIPFELRSHLRYPRDFFAIQLKMYEKYHQVEPELFYQQAETWAFAKSGDKEVKPYYLTTTLQGCPNMEKFVLINPMTPVNRSNLSSLAVAGSISSKDCKEGYSKQIVIYKFEKEIQVDGPSQVSALVDQKPDISAQFTLWDQHGSKVRLGRMVILPIGDSLLYIQPVYIISATATKIPELVRIIVSMGNEVMMEKSLEEGLTKLEAKLRNNRQWYPKDKQEEPEQTDSQTGGNPIS